MLLTVYNSIQYLAVCNTSFSLISPVIFKKRQERVSYSRTVVKRG